jgi:predicted TIM-barrel fold metal-dependent hydrolase
MSDANTSPKTLDGWLGLAREDAIAPELPIIDPHHHLWDKETRFVSGKQPRYLLDELLADIGGGHNIRSTVHMQCGRMYRTDGPMEMRPVGETEFVNGIAAMSATGLYGETRICEGIVGYADLMLGARVEDVLTEHMRVAGGRFRGIRNMSPYHPDPTILRAIPLDIPENLLGHPVFREGFERLVALGLSFDAWLYFTQTGDVADLARAFPAATIVLDHVGSPLGVGSYAGRREAVFAEWRRNIEALAACPNVKLGGMGMKITGFGFHERPIPPSSAELAEAWRPYMEVCIAAFGPERCMFESNFPVDKESGGYTVFWNAFKRIAAQYSKDEQRALFSGTAARVYRLRPVS